jgi:hypothetical protein
MTTNIMDSAVHGAGFAPPEMAAVFGLAPALVDRMAGAA